MILDYQFAIQASAGNEQLANDLLKLFIKQLSDYQQQIQKSFLDPIELQKIVHKIHGALQYIGAPKLHQTIAQLDGNLASLRDEQLENIKENLFDLFAEIQAAQFYTAN